MTKRISKDKYEIRTLSYYQSIGGLYNDIITILTRMRVDGKARGTTSPARLLNEGEYWWSVIENNAFNDDQKYVLPKKLNHPLLLSIVACIAADKPDIRYYLMGRLDPIYYFVEDIKAILKSDSLYYPYFKDLLDKEQKKYKEGLEYLQSDIHQKKLKEEEEKVSCLEKELKVKNELIVSLNDMIAKLSSKIDELAYHNKEMENELVIAEHKLYEGSNFDKKLSLNVILDWIKGRHHYNYTEQVFRMLADLKDNVASDEEREKIRQVEEEMLDKNQVQAVFNQNFGLNSNMMTGMVSNPQIPIGMTQEEIVKLFHEFLNQRTNG